MVLPSVRRLRRRVVSAERWSQCRLCAVASLVLPLERVFPWRHYVDLMTQCLLVIHSDVPTSCNVVVALCPTWIETWFFGNRLMTCGSRRQRQTKFHNQRNSAIIGDFGREFIYRRRRRCHVVSWCRCLYQRWPGAGWLWLWLEVCRCRVYKISRYPRSVNKIVITSLDQAAHCLTFS